jgi:hypothetical protein
MISRSDNMTSAGQPYVPATLPAFAANILWVLQGKSAQIISSIKQLKVLMKVKATAVGTGEVMEKSDEGKDD